MHNTRQQPARLRKFTEAQISCALWLANATSGIDTIFPDGGSRFQDHFMRDLTAICPHPCTMARDRCSSSSLDVPFVARVRLTRRKVAFSRPTGTTQPEVETSTDRARLDVRHRATLPVPERVMAFDDKLLFNNFKEW